MTPAFPTRVQLDAQTDRLFYPAAAGQLRDTNRLISKRYEFLAQIMPTIQIIFHAQAQQRERLNLLKILIALHHSTIKSFFFHVPAMHSENIFVLLTCSARFFLTLYLWPGSTHLSGITFS
jgi:hypothetical protein